MAFHPVASLSVSVVVVLCVGIYVHYRCYSFIVYTVQMCACVCCFPFSTVLFAPSFRGPAFSNRSSVPRCKVQQLIYSICCTRLFLVGSFAFRFSHLFFRWRCCCPSFALLRTVCAIRIGWSCHTIWHYCVPAMSANDGNNEEVCVCGCLGDVATFVNDNFSKLRKWKM